ncbi:LysE family translocator [Arcobacter sp. L]|uniref:LysE family translocator n=1 Tax=Arcobacter sp. L TaxID=944547 RepID=UPI0002295A6B|nr:LysE family translocator [Arcobacter sp. L]BAK71938.1 lysine transport protein [Arcobacter sp. L]
MEQYLNEFVFLASAIFLALMSPGPDFMVTLKQSINHERKYAIISSFGISIGIVFHLAYTILGFSFIIKVFPMFLDIIRYIGATYLIYIGYKSFKSSHIKIEKDNQKKMTIKKAFMLGFFCNVFNPKATMFFLSIFSIIVNESTPMYVQLLFGLFCVIANFVWYSLIALFLTRKKSIELFDKYSNIINKVIGAILIFFGFYFILSS